MKRIRAIIIDDEPLARERIRTLLREESDIEIAAECGDGRKAVAAIRRHAPDLVFLDVQMPELDGFGVLEAVGAERVPVVIFVTAYDKYALRAFDVHALDYLLKPFDRDRFHRALGRARAQLRGQRDSADRRLLALLDEVRGAVAPASSRTSSGAPRRLERLVVKSAGRVFFLRTEEIDWIESAGNYVKMHAGRDAHLVRETMSALEAQLDPAAFVRIHRSTIVNLARIRELQPMFHGDYTVLLRDGRELTLSRNYRDRLEKLLGRRI